jgi:hypothetical protein
LIFLVPMLISSISKSSFTLFFNKHEQTFLNTNVLVKPVMISIVLILILLSVIVFSPKFLLLVES